MNTTKIDHDKITLDTDESDVLESVERGEWKSVANLKREKNIAKKAATNTLRQTSDHS